MHKFVKVTFQVVKFIDSDLRIEDTLEPEEGKDEIVEDKIFSLLWAGDSLRAKSPGVGVSPTSHEGVS